MVLAPVLAFGWGLAPAHAHPGHSDDHAHGVVHRHLEAHRLGPTHHTTIEIADDDDDNVVWLNDATIMQVSYQLPSPVAVATVLTDLELSRPSWFPITQNESAPAHGPPRASLSFRGPPLPA